MSVSFETFYGICLVAGAVYGLFVGIFSGVLGDHDISSGHDIDMSHGDFGGSMSFSPLSPVVISTFLVMFGGSGLIYMSVFGIDGVWSMLPALVTALGTGTGVFFVFDYIFKHTQGGVQTNLAKLVGAEAEVIVTIPAKGMGEIAYSTQGGRSSSPARSAAGVEIPKNSIVRITRIVGGTFLVASAEGDDTGGGAATG